MIRIGDMIPGFSLKDQENKVFESKELKGKKMLLSFHPLAWTPVCTNQMKSLEANMETLSKFNAVPLGFSIDHPFCKGAWAKDMGIESVRLLCDFWPHGGYAQKLGIFREKDGISERANIIVNEEGKVLFVKIYPIPELPDMQEIIDFLE